MLMSALYSALAIVVMAVIVDFGYARITAEPIEDPDDLERFGPGGGSLLR
jgi:hypothetical protein